MNYPKSLEAFLENSAKDSLEDTLDGTTEITAEQRAELELAVAELAFWLDFAKWWRGKYCGREEPRITELLEQAEQRYLAARTLAGQSSKCDGSHKN